MKKLIFFVIFIIIFSGPASSSEIDERKSDIYFANGILTTEAEADQHLQDRLFSIVRNGIYNGDEDEMVKYHYTSFPPSRWECI